jgi:hypothetical protein
MLVPYCIQRTVGIQLFHNNDGAIQLSVALENGAVVLIVL